MMVMFLGGRRWGHSSRPFIASLSLTVNASLSPQIDFHIIRHNESSALHLAAPHDQICQILMLIQTGLSLSAFTRAKRHTTMAAHPLSILTFQLVFAADKAGPLPCSPTLSFLCCVSSTSIFTPDANKNTTVVISIICSSHTWLGAITVFQLSCPQWPCND